MNLEDICMSIIAQSGEAKTFAFQAMDAIEEEDYSKADYLMKKAHKSITKAHKVQTEILVNEARGEKSRISILLIHAQDHFMTSMLAVELIERMIKMRK